MYRKNVHLYEKAAIFLGFFLFFCGFYLILTPLISHHTAVVGLFLDHQFSYDDFSLTSFSAIPFYDYRPLFVICMALTKIITQEKSFYAIYVIGALSTSLMTFVSYSYLRQRMGGIAAVTNAMVMVMISPLLLLQVVSVEDNIVFYSAILFLLFNLDDYAKNENENENEKYPHRIALVSCISVLACFFHMLNIFLFAPVLCSIFLSSKKRSFTFFMNYLLFFMGGAIIVSPFFSGPINTFLQMITVKIKMMILGHDINVVGGGDILPAVFKTIPLYFVFEQRLNAGYSFQLFFFIILIILIFYAIIKSYKEGSYFMSSFGVSYFFVTLLYEPYELQRWDYMWLFVMAFFVKRCKNIQAIGLLFVIIPICSLNIYYIYKQRVDFCPSGKYCMKDLNSFLRKEEYMQSNTTSWLVPLRFFSLNSRVLLRMGKPIEKIYFTDANRCYQPPISLYLNNKITKDKMFSYNIVNNLPVVDDFEKFQVNCPH